MALYHFHVSRVSRGAGQSAVASAAYRAGEELEKPDGTKVFNAVPTTDWGRPETLEDWRKAWAKMVNDYFKARKIEASIDNRSYANQGIEKLAQVHEGPAVRQMEQRGIATRKGSLNRWINST